MRICILTHTFPRNQQDSAAAFMKEFADGLVLAGNDVFVLTPFDPTFARSKDRFKLRTYRYIWPSSWHVLGYSRAMERDIKLRWINFILLPFMIIFGTMALIKLVKEENIDLINVHWIIPNGLIALFVSKTMGIPYVVTLPGTDAFLAFKYKLFGFISKVIAEGAAGIFSNSPLHLKRILNLGVKPKFSDIIVYPSIVDSQGNVDGGPVSALESMACGKPQILTNVLGMASFIENGESGFIIKQKNETALSDAILKLVKSPSLRKRMGRVNRILVKNKLSNKKIGEVYTGYFRQILDLKP